MKKRDTFAGYDQTINKAFCFFFAENKKEVSMYISYRDDKELEVASNCLALYQLFWSQMAIPFEEIQSLATNDPALIQNNMKLEIEMH